MVHAVIWRTSTAVRTIQSPILGECLDVQGTARRPVLTGAGGGRVDTIRVEK